MNGIQMDWKLQKRCFRAISVAVVASYLFTASLYSILEFLVEIPPIPIMMSSKYSFVEFFRSIYLTQFVLASLTLLLRFKSLNNRIGNSTTEFNIKDTTVIAQLYRQLCEGIEILNETFTFHLIPIFASLIVSSSRRSKKFHKILFLLQVTIIFGMYGTIVQILHPTEVFMAALCTNSLGAANCCCMICAVVFFGSRLSSEASKTSIIYNKFQASLNASDAYKLNFIYVMTQLKSRSISVENFLFKIDWTVVLAVRVLIKRCVNNLSFHSTDNFNGGNIFNNHLSIWTMKWSRGQCDEYWLPII